MFFPFPIRTEKETVKLPYLTMGLILVNLVVWVITDKIVGREFQDLSELNARMFTIEQPYLQRLNQENPEAVRSLTYDDLHKRYGDEVARKSFASQDEEWRALYAEYQSMLDNRFFMRWGLVPSRFSFLKLLFSLFLHANFMHLFGNMLFLWAVGCNLEDDWGWWGFLVCYLLSGVAAWGLHALRFPDSNVPGIGASGAIAGIMGVFLVKYYSVKIKFFYIWLLRFWRPFGFFSTYAYTVIPIWFILQLIGARGGAASGVGYYAHIGGFLFGAAVAGSFKALGLGEGLFDAPASSAVALSTAAAMPRIVAGVPLARQAKAALQADPRNVRKYFYYGRAFARRGNGKNAAILCNMGMNVLFQSPQGGSPESLASAFSELSASGCLDGLSEKNLYRLAAGLQKAGAGQDAVALYMMYANHYPSGKARERSLFQSYVTLRDQVGDTERAGKALDFFRREYPDSGMLGAPGRLAPASQFPVPSS
jgi:membrane associated rhomboid family serine protease